MDNNKVATYVNNMSEMSASGPQIDIPVGLEAQGLQNNGVAWTGLTIREILEKVDLFNITTVDDDELKKQKTETGHPMTNYSKNKEGKTVISATNPESAFLGPKIWDKPISLPPLDDTEFSVMNIDEFLNENNINLDEEDSKQNLQDNVQSMDTEEMSIPSPSGSSLSSTSTSPATPSGRNQLPKGGNDFLYAESKRARLEREREERKRKLEMQIDFAPEDLALATVPGAEFDPRTRQFSVEELRPQPIIRKRKKQYVPSDSKDGKYWEKRIKNNIAARRSREARRLKENQIALRAAFLEKENGTLKAQVDDVLDENARLRQEKKTLMEKLSRYEQAL